MSSAAVPRSVTSQLTGCEHTPISNSIYGEPAIVSIAVLISRPHPNRGVAAMNHQESGGRAAEAGHPGLAFCRWPYPLRTIRTLP
jgi:hypothetical protein